MRNFWSDAIKFFGLEPSVRQFKRLGRANRPNDKDNNSIILVEKRYWPDGEIALLPFLQEATRFYNASAVTYEMYPQQSKFHLKKIIKHRFSVLNSIIPSRYILISGFPTKESHHDLIADYLLSSALTKETFQNYRYRDILIGDLIYDHYLRRARKPTLNFQDPSLRFFTLEFLRYVDQFIEIFECQQVSALVVSHSTYHFGIPARVSLQRKVPTYLVDLNSALRLNEISEYGYPIDWQTYKVELASFTEKRILEIRNDGKRCVDLRLSGGELPSTIPKNSSSSLNLELDPEITRKRGAKVLVALHDFFDAVHWFGNAFYPDYYEWLLEICKVSAASNLTWIIKPHPSELRDTSEVLRKLKSDFPHIVIVPADVDNAALVEHGVKYCLTVYGSIASELPELGVTVINAASNNPHKDFEFCITPRNKREYIEILRDLENLEFNINLNHLYEYNYMRFLQSMPSWCVSNYNGFIDAVGSVREINSEVAFSWYFRNREDDLLMCVRGAVREFLRGREAYLSSLHFKRSGCRCGNGCKFLNSIELNF